MKQVNLTALFLYGTIQTILAQNSINGRIIDTYDYGVAFANVLLLNRTDSALVKGAVTDADGYYTLSNIVKGNYLIESYMVGYSKSYSSLTVNEEQNNLSMDVIVLAEDTKQLDEVVIKADKPLYEMEMGKMVVNIQSSITSSGQSVIDVLEKSPNIFVDRQNGALALGGKSGVIVLMNGKRSRMPLTAVYQMLEGLNAGDVEKIEIMTVPPANYDADGDAGFINIVMKQGTRVGTNGSVMVNAGYGSGPRAGGSLNLSHQANKLSLYGNYSYNHIDSKGEVNNYREAIYEGNTTNSSTESERDPNRSAHNYQFGFDYSIGKKTVVGALVGGYNNLWQMKAFTNSIYNYSATTDSLIKIKTSETNHWKQLMGNINLQHTFEKGQILNINLDYLTYDNENPSEYVNDYYDFERTFIHSDETRITKDTPIDIWVGKLDYSMNFGASTTLETGIKGTFSSLINDIVVEEKKGGDWILNELISNYADLTEDVLAAFSAVKIKFDERTTLNAGLRYEHTKTFLSSLEQKGLVDRKYGDFFPTLYLSRKINDNNLLQFSYGRRITRPTFNEMAPFVVFIDPYTFFSGNAAILPSYTNSIKGDYSFKSYIFSVQYSHDKNPIFRFQPKIDPETNIMVLTSDNVDRGETVSTTITLPFSVTDWWEMQNNLSGNWQMIASKSEENFKREQIAFQINTTQTFKLPKKFALELSGFYMSPVINGYFNWLARGFVNLGIQKELKNEGSLRFSCNDIFETSQLRWKTDDEFIWSGNVKFEKRVFSLTYTQKFGNKKIKDARKRSLGSEEEMRRVTN